MDAEREIGCPECGHEFAPVERVWHLCFECLRIFDPGERDDRFDHKTDGRCTRRLGMGLRCYTREEAEQAREDYIERRWTVTSDDTE